MRITAEQNGEPAAAGADRDYAYIVSLNREDRGKALVALAKRGRVYSYRGGIYELSPEQRLLVDEMGLPYREATPAEVEAARGSVHDSAAFVL
jgi:hypothetical protein